MDVEKRCFEFNIRNSVEKMITSWLCITIGLLLYSSIGSIQPTEAKNILAFLPSCSPSHLIIEMAAVKAMAEREHNITVVSVLPLKSEWMHPNMKHIKLDKGAVDMNVVINFVKMKGFEQFRNSLSLMRVLATQNAAIFDDPKFQELLDNPGNQFDLLLYGYFLSDYFFGIAEHFDCPVALIWPNIPVLSILNLIGNPLELSYTVLTMFNIVAQDDITFMFRLKNVLSVGAHSLVLGIQDRKMREIYE